MVSTATIVAVLVAAFLLGVKFTVDLIRQRRRKVDISRCERAWSRPVVQSPAKSKFGAVLRHLELRIIEQNDEILKLLSLRVAGAASRAYSKEAEEQLVQACASKVNECNHLISAINDSDYMKNSMLGKCHVFVVGRGVGLGESRPCDFAIHGESSCFTGCCCSGTKGGRRQITYHHCGVVATDDPPSVSRKSHAVKIHTGIYECEQGRSNVVRKCAAAEENLGISISADGCAGWIGGAPIVMNLICAEEPCLAIAI